MGATVCLSNRVVLVGELGSCCRALLDKPGSVTRRVFGDQQIITRSVSKGRSVGSWTRTAGQARQWHPADSRRQGLGATVCLSNRVVLDGELSSRCRALLDKPGSGTRRVFGDQQIITRSVSKGRSVGSWTRTAGQARQRHPADSRRQGLGATVCLSNRVVSVGESSSRCRALLDEPSSGTERAHDKILRAARTIADLDASETTQAHHLMEAVNHRILDRNLPL